MKYNVQYILPKSFPCCPKQFEDRGDGAFCRIWQASQFKCGIANSQSAIF